MAAKDLDLKMPDEFAPQFDTLKNLLQEINGKIDADDVPTESVSEGKKLKSSVKNQLSLYKKELNDTKDEIERVKKALDLINEIREGAITSLKKDLLNDTCKETILSDVLKETAPTLPLWIRPDLETDIPPLCGAIQVTDDYVATVGDLVAASVTVRGKKLKEWILAEVSDYCASMEEYEVRDIDEKQTCVYLLKKDKVIPLPKMRANPVDCSAAIFAKGTTILALYENTTCFYKGVVDEPPLDLHQPYQIAFEDTDCKSGYSPPTSVPQQYVLVYRKFENP